MNQANRREAGRTTTFRLSITPALACEPSLIELVEKAPLFRGQREHPYRLEKQPPLPPPCQGGRNNAPRRGR